MVRLTILRHAKSSWATPGGSDIDRVLSDKGQQQAARLSHWLGNRDDKPDACICSPAKRTRQTWDGIAAALDDVSVDIRERLYSGAPDTYLEEIWASDARHLLLIGHNPTCDELVRSLARPGGEALRASCRGAISAPPTGRPCASMATICVPSLSRRAIWNTMSGRRIWTFRARSRRLGGFGGHSWRK